MGIDRLSQYELGSLNENRIVTAQFKKYVSYQPSDGKTYISPELEEGELPTWIEGYGVDGHKLLMSLCNLYLQVKDADESKAIQHMIAWCQDNVTPYYHKGFNESLFDYRTRNDAEIWEMLVNVVESFAFKIKTMMQDLKDLYLNTEMLLLFRSIRDGEKVDSRLLNTPFMKEFEGLGALSELELLKEMEGFISRIPKFPMELMIDELGEFRIAPAFTSVFEAAYFALVRFVAAGADMPLRDGGKTPLAVCDSCGKIFIKSGNRQKYCGDDACQKERNRRKANRYVAKKQQEKQV